MHVHQTPMGVQPTGREAAVRKANAARVCIQLVKVDGTRRLGSTRSSCVAPKVGCLTPALGLEILLSRAGALPLACRVERAPACPVVNMLLLDGRGQPRDSPVCVLHITHRQRHPAECGQCRHGPRRHGATPRRVHAPRVNCASRAGGVDTRSASSGARAHVQGVPWHVARALGRGAVGGASHLQQQPCATPALHRLHARRCKHLAACAVPLRGALCCALCGASCGALLQRASRRGEVASRGRGPPGAA